MADAARELALQTITVELERAYKKHGREPWGRHEFFAILKEEVDELWDAIKADEQDEQVVAEAIEVAAMVFRYLETGDRYRGASVGALERALTAKRAKLAATVPMPGVAQALGDAPESHTVTTAPVEAVNYVGTVDCPRTSPPPGPGAELAASWEAVEDSRKVWLRDLADGPVTVYFTEPAEWVQAIPFVPASRLAAAERERDEERDIRNSLARLLQRERAERDAAIEQHTAACTQGLNRLTAAVHDEQDRAEQLRADLAKAQRERDEARAKLQLAEQCARYESDVAGNAIADMKAANAQLAAAERELEGVRRVEAWLRDRTISRFVDADRGRLAACENFVTKAPETRATADSLAALGHALPDDTAQEGR